MTNAIFVAVRLKSSRLKRKALLPLFENEGVSVSLIECLISRLKLSKKADLVVLCTSSDPEDDPIEHIALSHSIKCFRGDKLDVMSRFIEAAQIYNVDTIIRVTGDNFADPLLLMNFFFS